MPHPSRHLGSYTGPFALRMFFRAVLLVGMVLICSGCRPADRGPIVQLTDSGKQDEHQEHEHFPEHWPEDIMQASKRISELLGGTAGSTQGISTSLELADLAPFKVENILEVTINLARQAVDAGARAIVSSPLEVAAIREAVGESITLITPGVRFSEAIESDQKRVLTPREAINSGRWYS